MTTARLGICDYCERYGRACGRDHTWDNINAWHRDWRGNPRPVSVALINAILGGDPGKLIGKRVTLPDGREGRVISVWRCGTGGYRAAVSVGRASPQERFDVTDLTPSKQPVGGVGVQGSGNRVLALVADILAGRENLGMADLSSTALERALDSADGDIADAIREELAFRAT